MTRTPMRFPFTQLDAPIRCILFGLVVVLNMGCGSDESRICERFVDCRLIGSKSGSSCEDTLRRRMPPGALKACASCVEAQSCSTIASCNAACTPGVQ